MTEEVSFNISGVYPHLAPRPCGVSPFTRSKEIVQPEDIWLAIPLIMLATITVFVSIDLCTYLCAESVDSRAEETLDFPRSTLL